MKKRNKVSAEFNMSSLTDIIFLLLIFFMLTSSLVTPNALNLSLPGSSKTKTTTPSKYKLTNIKVERNGKYYLNGTKVSLSAIERQMKRLKQAEGVKAVVTISPHARASNDRVVAVLNAAWKIGITASLLEPRG